MMYSSTNVTVYIIINMSSKCLPEKKIVRYVFLINGFNFPFDFFVSQVLAFLERLLFAYDQMYNSIHAKTFLQSLDNFGGDFKYILLDITIAQYE